MVEFWFALGAELVAGARTVLIGFLTSRCDLAAGVVFLFDTAMSFTTYVSGNVTGHRGLPSSPCAS
jgi:hypothetical protein